MKKVKRIKIVALVAVILVFASCMMAPTLSRYVGKTTVQYKGETELDYTVNGVFTVRSQEELFSAINQGYTYVQLSKDIENPLIITQQSTNLEADLILDLNGIEIQRNGPEPILNIGPGVKLTVTDTSSEQTGGLYNPVGSVFNITGGTLSVVTGDFESGPRFSEYLSYNHDLLESTATTERTIVEDEPEYVIFYSNKSGESHTGTLKLRPIIRSYPVSTGEIIYTHGNLYCDKSVTLTSGGNILFDQAKSATDEFYIPRDTYLYYRTDETGSSGSAQLNNPEDAEWYYTYYVEAGTYAYVSAQKPDDYAADPEKYVEITIYGYEDTVKSASDVSDRSHYFAAIQMQSGTLEVQDGGFYSYFGLPTTACVNASGGTIKVGNGYFSSRIPDAVNLISSSIKLENREAFDEEYFKSFKWVDGSFGTGSRAGQGQGYCILNHGTANVNIISGQFCSTNNNTIYMGDGTLTIGEGTFRKYETVVMNAFTDNKSAVHMDNGVLSLKNSAFMVKGNYTAGICMDSGSLTVDKGSFDIVGGNTYAIYSTVNTAVKGNDFTLKDTDITMTGGTNQIGIYTMNGQVNLSTSGSNAANITISGNNGKGIYADVGGSVTAEHYNVTLNGSNSTGIYSVGGAVDLSDGEITLISNNNCYGVYASSTANKILVALKNMLVDVGYAQNTGDKNVNCASSIGVFMASSVEGSSINLDNTKVNCYELGLVLRGGSLTLQNGGEINTRKASAIFVDGGTLTFSENDSKNALYNLISSNTNNTTFLNSYEITIPTVNGGTENYANVNGIHVTGGGSFNCYGKLVYTHTGLQNSPYAGGALQAQGAGTYYYNGLKVRSYAVFVDGGGVNIDKCDITATSGGGVYCSGGKITLGDEDAVGTVDELNKLIKITTTGTLTSNDTYDAISTQRDNWENYKSLTGGHAIELNGGSIDVHHGTFYAKFGNGLQVTGNSTGSGVINVYNGRFEGHMYVTNNTYKNETLFSGHSGPAAHYGLKVMGAATVNIYNGVFDGGNGGAFVTGIDKYTNNSTYSCSADSAAINRAYVYVYKGEFGNESSVDAFNVYDNATVVFGAHTQAELTEEFDMDAAAIRSAIKVHGRDATVALNPIGNNAGRYTRNVSIYYGDYTDKDGGNTHGIWTEGNGITLNIYNSRSNPAYTVIRGDEADGNKVAGTQFYAGN